MATMSNSLPVWFFLCLFLVGVGALKHAKLLESTIKDDVIPGSYIVVMHDVAADDVTTLATTWAREGSAKLEHTYKAAITGASLSGVSDAVLSSILENPSVRFVEPDRIVHEDMSVQVNPLNWGLDRLDRDSLPLDGLYSYVYTGANVEIYIMDSGVRMNHREFAGNRARCGVNYVAGEPCDDLRYHGTHVAGVAAGSTYGVAKDASIIAIKVLNSAGSGSWSSVLAGCDWLRQRKLERPRQPMVVNISLGGGRNTAINEAVDALVSAGVVTIVSAGNNNYAACNNSPASASSAITVGSVGRSDSRSQFSNYGSCVDIFAPGESILSADIGSNVATAERSGTSFAAPLVAGVAALYLEKDPTMDAREVMDAILADGVSGVLSGLSGSPNLLLSTVELNQQPVQPTLRPTHSPPTYTPTKAPVKAPTASPTSTMTPTASPSVHPSLRPSTSSRPSAVPTISHAPSSSVSPSAVPTMSPSSAPSNFPCGRFLLGQCEYDFQCCSNRCRIIQLGSLTIGRCGLIPKLGDER